MCHCVLCNCLWINCGKKCMGMFVMCLCGGVWCSQPETIPEEHQKICHNEGITGLGIDCHIFGFLCCSPKWMVEWSRTFPWLLIYSYQIILLKYINHFLLYRTFSSKIKNRIHNCIDILLIHWSNFKLDKFTSFFHGLSNIFFP